MKKCLFYAGKGSNHLTFFTTPDLFARQAFMWYYWYMSLSGFFTILQYLVLTVFFPSFICSFTTLVLEHTPSICFSLLLCKLFPTPCSPCIFLLSPLSLEIALSMYVCGFLWMCSRMASSRSVFVCLLAWWCMWSFVVIGVDLMCCLLHVIILPALVTCILYDLMMIVIALSNYCTMGPWSPISSLNYYSWPYGDRHKDSWSIIVLVILLCLCIRFLWCSSSLSILIGFLSITGIMPLLGN